ncbi:hypothetical protein [Nocardioides sp. Leaf307]|uniref:hypothetical protein n=1 Tax=Nocardioides sp. Leaf307 TaxID=1736331 RepID=UPI00070319C7|nr:hypothetical protein [Nocardioides sp. Leaf307]KQQ42793.1 hypothetical protein ASF50_01765 [Nocardioides sp. Leaf307]
MPSDRPDDRPDGPTRPAPGVQGSRTLGYVVPGALAVPVLLVAAVLVLPLLADVGAVGLVVCVALSAFLARRS